MLRQLKAGSIPLPKIYVASSEADAAMAKEHGLPYVRWRGSDDDLVKIVLLPTLMKMFPFVKWEEQLKLGTRKQILVSVPGNEEKDVIEYDEFGEHCTDDGHDEFGDGDVSDIASDWREFSNKGSNATNDIELDAYVGDMTAYVNLDELQSLRLLPSFMDDIATNIKRNIGYSTWTEGYNKKRKVPVGNFQSAHEADNLIILDVSGSIPHGVSATMISLIDTMRNQVNADLIITSSRSQFYKYGEELPRPDEIRRQFGYANERDMFFDILNKNVRGKHYGNVISFGDYDCPSTKWRDGRSPLGVDLNGTRVDAVWHYHTSYKESTGYAQWADMACVDKTNIHYDTKWCNMIDRGGWW